MLPKLVMASDLSLPVDTRRARRVTIGVMLAGVAVVAALMVTHRGPREHVEAWWYLLTTETRTVLPLTPLTLSTTDTVQGLSLGPFEWDKSAGETKTCFEASPPGPTAR